MDNQRTLRYLSFLFILFLMWQAWQQDYAPKPAPQSVATTSDSVGAAIPEPALVEEQARDTPAMASMMPENTQEKADRRFVKVVTDVYTLEIDSKGGDIRQLKLRQYPESSTAMDEEFELLSSKESRYHIAQSGLLSSDSAAPNHHAIYRVEQDEYELKDGSDEVVVNLYWEENGVKVKKVLTFKRDSYVIDVEHFVSSANSSWTGSQYRQLTRGEADTRNESSFIYTYTGGVVYNDEIKYEKIDFSDIMDNDLKLDMKGGWVAMIQHYFLSAWIPDQLESNFTYSRNPNPNRYILGMRSPAINIAAGDQARFHSRLVAGPKLPNRLEGIAPGLELTVDYGILTILAKPLYWLLEKFHGIFNNWGWAIIFLTITVKLLFYKLSETSYRSMAKMRKVAPRLQALKERYGEDRQRMSQAMMQMYKEEKINPLGGCLPIVVQIPVFIALYWVLLESVEMRNAPFALWITNLSEQDPYFILPVLMGISMFIQQKLNPAPMDPMQQKIFQFLPIVFTVFFLFFPSGLVLYWVVNNTLSIAQQYVITKRIEAS